MATVSDDLLAALTGYFGVAQGSIADMSQQYMWEQAGGPEEQSFADRQVLAGTAGSVPVPPVRPFLVPPLPS